MNLFQSPEWEQFKLTTGYQKSYRIDDILILQKRLPLGRTMLYSPMVDQSQISNLFSVPPEADEKQNYISKLKNLGREKKAIFYRLELDIPVQQYDNSIIQKLGFAKSFEEMQPEQTLILNISKSEEDILAGMKQKGRYNIKIAERSNIKIRKSRQIDDFYRLYEETAKRQKITFRNKQYFRALLDNLEPKGYCELFEAYIDKSQITSTKSQTNSKQFNNSTIQQSDSSPGVQNDKAEIVLAAAIISFYKNRATYLFGSSSSEMRNLMAPYKLHWHIIQEAKRRGFIEYDFFGIAPDDNPKHPWAGVTRFKKQFGGNEVQSLGSWDLVFKPMEYKLFKIAEKIRRH